MPSSRRQFLTYTALGMMSAAIEAGPAPSASAQATPAQATDLPPGAPSAFGTSPPVGPEVSPTTFAEAEKLVQVEMTAADRATAASNWRMQIAPLYEFRTGPRKFRPEATLAPATQWTPSLIGDPHAKHSVHEAGSFIRSANTGVPLPANEADIAFAPVTQLSRWIESRQITSERLTQIYLTRLERFDPRLHCVITLTRDHALAQARQADAEIAAGHYRGPLHGIPWGAKDLLDTASIPTTYGAEPFRNRIPATDSAVVARLNAAGAVLVAKLSLGALALNDIWFGGQTMNPWLLEEGSSGSSGVTGLRPTYGRVARTGAMTLCWSLDKLGPMARSVEDTILVLNAISGPDAGDVASIPSKLDFNAEANVESLRVGYFPVWMKESPATDVDRAALETVMKLGMKPVAVSIPDWPYDSLQLILFAEAAAAFEELTLSHEVDELKAQVPDAWPNVFRQSRFLSAVDVVQADRFRRKVAQEMARIFTEVDLLLVPSLRDEMLVVPHGITLIGRLFDEGTLAEAGIALENAFGVASERAPGF